MAIPGFAGGVSRVRHPLSVGDTQTLRCRNLIPVTQDCLQRRSGYSLYTTMTYTGGTIKRVTAIKDCPNLGFMFVATRALTDTGAYYDTAWIITPSSGTTGTSLATGTDRFSVVDFIDNLYFCNGNEIWKTPAGGASGTNPLTGTNIPTGIHTLIIWKDRLWCASKTAVYYSDNLAPDTFQASSVITPRKSQGDSEQITGMAVITVSTATDKLQSMLLICKENSLWVLTFGETAPDKLDQLSGEVGCVCPDTICQTTDGVIFASRDNVYLISDAEPIKIGTAIRNVLNGTDREFGRKFDTGTKAGTINDFYLSRNKAVYHDGFYRLSYASTNIDSEANFKNDSEWWLDLRGGFATAAWYGDHPIEMTAYGVGGSTLYSGSATSGAVYKWDKNLYTDNGSSYAVTLWSKHYAPESAFMIKKFQRLGLLVAAEKTTTLYTDWIIDGGRVLDESNALALTASTSLYDVAKWDVGRWQPADTLWQQARYFFTTSDRGRVINFKMTETSDGNILLYNGILAFLKTGRIL